MKEIEFKSKLISMETKVENVLREQIYFKV
jgi:hypothetical protein